jgi:very-short-patch-repair endonuclease
VARSDGGILSTEPIGDDNVIRKHNKLLSSNANELRNNMTSQEKHLWYDYLREYPVRILRQKIIENFIADFYCSKGKLIIEIDGSQHYSEEGLEHDQERTIILNNYGLKVIRFSNLDIDRSFDAVCQMIDNEIKKRVINIVEN